MPDAPVIPPPSQPDPRPAPRPTVLAGSAPDPEPRPGAPRPWGAAALVAMGLAGALGGWLAHSALTPAAAPQTPNWTERAVQVHQALEQAASGQGPAGYQAPQSDEPQLHELERVLSVRGYALESANHWPLNAGGEYHTLTFERHVHPDAPRERWTLNAVFSAGRLTHLGWIFDEIGTSIHPQAVRAAQFDAWNQAQVEEDLIKVTAGTLLPRLNTGLVYGSAVDAVKQPCPDPVADLEFSESIGGWDVRACHRPHELHVWIIPTPLG